MSVPEGALEALRDLAKTPTGYFAAVLAVVWWSWDWEQGQPYLRVAALASAVAILGRAFTRALRWADRRLLEGIDSLKARRAFKKRLDGLAPAEKEVLDRHVASKKQAMLADVTDPPVARLLGAGMLVASGEGLGPIGKVRMVSVRDAEWVYLNEQRAHLPAPGPVPPPGGS